MRNRFLVFFLTAVCGLAGEFYTGQGARLVIGQSTFTEQSPESSKSVLGGVGAVAFANDTLIVADSNRVFAEPFNHRVLIYRNVSSFLPDLRAELPEGPRCPVCVGVADVQLGHPEFEEIQVPSQNSLRLPTGVATDGNMLAVADTHNNRVLIWRSIPAQDGTPADVVLGQQNFTSNQPNAGSPDVRVPTAGSLRGPQGVWIQGSRLYVADTSNNRVLIWNSIPTSNGQNADVVLGQPNFTTFVPQNLVEELIDPQPTNMISPVSVSSDGQRLYVADLGHNRVLIWNSLPTSNGQAADIALGQPNMNSARANNVRELCQPIDETDPENPIYPFMCAATMDFPRSVLAAGGRLFIADGGNDRVLVYNRIPTNSGEPADVILGQISDRFNENSDSANELGRSSANTMRTPMGMAWDGENLFVADPFNRRVVVFTAADQQLLPTAARNAASREVYAIGSVTLDGAIQADDEVTIKVEEVEYTYEIKAGDTFETVTDGLVALINAGQGDPFVFASGVRELGIVLLTARQPGSFGDLISYSASVSPGAQIFASAGGATLRGGGEATQVAPGTILSIVGENLADQTLSADLNAETLPRKLGGVTVYVDGMRAPLWYVSPRQINIQLPFEVHNATAGNLWVRIERAGGAVHVTSPVSVPVVQFNPGIFGGEGVDPRPAVALHFSSAATGTVSVDGSATAGDQAIVTIRDREYSYTVQTDDTLNIIRDRLVEMINEDPEVEAFPSGLFTRIRLRARVEGPEGNGIPIAAESKNAAGSDAGAVVMTATNTELCCANEAGALITDQNPALPGETIVVLATGLGLLDPSEATSSLRTGERYRGVALNTPREFVSSLAGGRTANVLFAGMQQNSFSIYEVHLELNSGLETSPASQLTIAQGFFVSNIVTIPVVNPESPEAGSLSSSPGGGSGRQQVFALRHVQREGTQPIGAFGALFNTTLDFDGSCLVTVDVNDHTIRVRDSSGNMAGGLVAGSEGTIEGQHCNVNAATSSVERDGNTTTARVDITFRSSFTGTKSFFLNGWNVAGQEIGWVTLGTWTVPQE